MVASLVAAGCSTQLSPLHDAPVALPALPEAAGPPVSLLVCRFDDLRGERLMTTSPIGLVPGPNLLYMGNTIHYVDRGGFAGSKNGRPLVRTGDLQTALPDLLAATIREARPDWPIEVTASPERCRAGGDAAYVIDGAIRRTDLRLHSNAVPLGVLALLGAPFTFLSFEGELDVEIRRADRGAIAWRHGFRIDERRAVGLYYGHEAAYSLFSSLLQEAVAHSVASAIHIAERNA
ncbi:hypothetical protein SAMN02745121_06230 [Nannocystis exedens]|uniref:Uncharacterized protein n=2 Tax=Nannocystis exedens TaxID=54 RepID=A0A1I2ESX7_9BACT|nr:hypothetical protein NAEX_06939 [Nannocystis exedens]SFE95330.1 hypothetical protein SAMN02745121_06230 [Nannocystis exedens]